MMKENNIIITGYGGQGVLTLAEIIAQTAFKQDYQVKQAELHGLAQRGGVLEAHLRFGSEIHSPLIEKAGADLILSLDLIETERALSFANEKTIVLSSDSAFWSEPEKISNKKIKTKIEKQVQRAIFVPIDQKVEKLTGDRTSINIYLLAVAIREKVLPFKAKEVWQSVEEKLKGRNLKENKEVFKAGLKK